MTLSYWCAVPALKGPSHVRHHPAPLRPLHAGSNARALDKARTLPADSLILDLEDAVAPDAKAAARAQVAQAVTAGGFGLREIVVRVNGLSTPWGADDIAAMAPLNPAAILVPKVNSAEEVRTYQRGSRRRGRSRRRALGDDGNAACHPERQGNRGVRRRLACFVMGTNDLVKEYRGQHTPGREGLLPLLAIALSRPGPTADRARRCLQRHRQRKGFAAICRQGAAMGFDGKTLIHPSQLATCNAIFAPSEAEVEAARKVIAAFDLPENKGKGAISLDGRMVELLHADIARRTVAPRQAITARAA